MHHFHRTPRIHDRDPLRLAPRNVETQAFAPDGVRISDGLAPGELVVTAGTQFMTPDKKVRIADAAVAAAATPTATVAAR